MLGLNLNHVSKRSPWKPSNKFVFSTISPSLQGWSLLKSLLMEDPFILQGMTIATDDLWYLLLTWIIFNPSLEK